MANIDNPGSIYIDFGRYSDSEFSLIDLEQIDHKYVSWLISEFVDRTHKEDYWYNNPSLYQFDTYQDDLIKGLEFIKQNRKMKK